MACSCTFNPTKKPPSFKEKMETYFKPYMMISDAFNWEMVLIFVEHKKNAIFYKGTENVKEFSKFFLKLFDSFECHNMLLLYKLLDIYEGLEEYISWFERHCRQRTNIHIEWLEMKCDPMKDMDREIVDHVHRIYRFRYKNYNICPEEDFKRVLGTIKSGNIILMKALIKNGLSYLPPEDCLKKILEENCLRTFLDALALRRETLDFIFMREQETGISNKWDILLIHNIGSWIGGFRRTALVFIAIKALLYRHKPDNLFSRYAKCFQLFCMTISEPLVTLHEMQDFFSIILRGLDPENLVHGFMQELSEVYPDFNTCYETRTLFDLCRSKIRLEAIKSGKTVPQAMLEMNVPVNLRKNLVSYE